MEEISCKPLYMFRNQTLSRLKERVNDVVDAPVENQSYHFRDDQGKIINEIPDKSSLNVIAQKVSPDDHHMWGVPKASTQPLVLRMELTRCHTVVFNFSCSDTPNEQYHLMKEELYEITPIKLLQKHFRSFHTPLEFLRISTGDNEENDCDTGDVTFFKIFGRVEPSFTFNLKCTLDSSKIVDNTYFCIITMVQGGGQQRIIEVKNLTPLWQLRYMIQDFGPYANEIIFNGNIFSDPFITVKDMGITTGSVVEWTSSSSPCNLIHVGIQMLLQKDKFSLMMAPDDTILDLKHEIKKLKKIGCEIALGFNGKKCHDEETLVDIGITKFNCDLSLCLLLRGGMYHPSSARNGVEVIGAETAEEKKERIRQLQEEHSVMMNLSKMEPFQRIETLKLVDKTKTLSYKNDTETTAVTIKKSFEERVRKSIKLLADNLVKDRHLNFMTSDMENKAMTNNDRDTDTIDYKLMLIDEDTLRRSAIVQNLMEEAEQSVDSEWMEIAEEVQRQVVIAHIGTTSEAAVEKALLHLRYASQENPDIAHYVKFNRARKGTFQVGDVAPNLSLLDATTGKPMNLLGQDTTGAVQPVQCNSKPTVIIAGSYS
jgi:hypothetical protein